MIPALLDTLDEGRRRRLENIRAAAGRIWARPLHRHYTQHGVPHSERIIALLDGLTEGLMRGEGRLSQDETFILLAAAYLHDIGMQDERFADGDLEEIRAHHHEQTERMIWLAWEDPARAFPLPLNYDPDIVEYVARTARGHCLDNLDGDEYDPLSLGNGEVRPRLLAALLRLGDALDIDHRRVDVDMMTLMNLPVLSQMHWWKCHYVSGVEVRDEYIRVGYRFPQDRPDYAEFITPLVEQWIRAELAQHEALFRQNGIKLALAQPHVRLMRLVKPLSSEVEALARRSV